MNESDLQRRPSSAASRSEALCPAYLGAYRDAIAKAGPTFEALLYFDRGTQERRFEVLAKIAPLAGRTIVDFGCGQADLVRWMQARRIDYDAYVGLDAMPEFITEARARLAIGGCRAARVEVCDFVECDYSRYASAPQTTFVFCGSLNMLSQGEASDLLVRAWRALRGARGNALVFNFLSRSPRYAGREDARLLRFSAAEMVAFALELTPLTVFCQHYLAGHDATVALLVP